MGIHIQHQFNSTHNCVGCQILRTKQQILGKMANSDHESDKACKTLYQEWTSSVSVLFPLNHFR
jgi:hypothetical protein